MQTLDQPSTQQKEYVVLQYYHFFPIENPHQFLETHKKLCDKIGLKGRILVAPDGINGTCSGTKEQTEMYKKELASIEGFEDMWFKQHYADKVPFPKMRVLYRKELVGFDQDLEGIEGGKHISPDEFHNLHKQAETDDNIVFIDMRSNWEAELGTVKGSVIPDIKYFRQLPKEMSKLKEHKDKKVVMFCTGGIRCEYASKYFKKEGFKDVNQLNGGIYNYCGEYPDGAFEGTCYVFDERKHIAFTDGGKISFDEDKLLEKKKSTCAFCNKPSARLVNDERNETRSQVICCESCDKKEDVSRVRRQRPLPTVPKTIPVPEVPCKHIGTVSNYFVKANVAEVNVKTFPKTPLKLAIYGHTSKITLTVDKLVNHEEPEGNFITFECDRVREGDKVYVLLE